MFQMQCPSHQVLIGFTITGIKTHKFFGALAASYSSTYITSELPTDESLVRNSFGNE